MVDPNVLIGGGLAAMFATFLIFFLLLGVAIYVYSAWALMTIGKKLNYHTPWLAWIPFANFAMVLQMGGFHWAWVFLVLGMFIPFVNIAVAIAVMILGFICMWRIFEQRNYPGWLALIGIGGLIPFIGILFSIASLVILGVVAWRDQ